MDTEAAWGHKPPITPKAKRAHHERGGVAMPYLQSLSAAISQLAFSKFQSAL